jgi:urease alpha subunit
VLPESSVTGPTGNSTAPTTSETADTMMVAASPNTTIAANLTASSRVRPAGTASR